MEDRLDVRFWIDSPAAMDRAMLVVDAPLRVDGWCLPPAGSRLEAIELCLGTTVVSAAKLGLERPDVQAAFPDRPDAIQSGFSADLPTGFLPPDDDPAVPLTVRARWDGQQHILAEYALRSGQEPDLERVSRFWKEQFEARRLNNSYWMNNLIVASHVNQLMTGTHQHWLGWLMSHYFAEMSSFDRALSVCCGDGAHELALLQSGKVRHLSGFDISAGALRQAEDRIRAAGFSDDRFDLKIADANRLVLEGRYDLILSIGAIHHVENLEGLLETLARALEPEGFFVLVEFIGPDRFQWTDRQVALVNRLLATIDPRYLRDGKRTTFGRPAVEEIMRIDPSEAIRSSDIMAVLREHFTISMERPFHGTIMHQLYPLLNSDLTNEGHEDFDSIVRLLLAFEDVLVEHGVIQSDFVFVVCRPKSGTAAGRS